MGVGGLTWVQERRLMAAEGVQVQAGSLEEGAISLMLTQGSSSSKKKQVKREWHIGLAMSCNSQAEAD